jgi:hypothetical protein
MMSVPGSVVHCIIVFYRFEWMVVRISSHPFAFPEINLFEKKKTEIYENKESFLFQKQAILNFSPEELPYLQICYEN